MMISEPDMQTRKTFRLLNPLCVKIAKDTQSHDLVSLLELLDTVDDGSLQILQEYVLFPLRLILKQDNKLSEDVHIGVCHCLCKVFSKTKIQQWQLLHDVFNCLCIKIGAPNQNKVADISEELKAALVDSIHSTVRAAQDNILHQFYSVSFLPVLGHAVSVLLHIASKESSRSLKVKAMECLVLLGQCGTKRNASLRQRIGDTFASFLPGISMALCHIATGDSKQGHTVTVNALNAWRKMVTVVLSDKALVRVQSEDDKPQSDVDDRIASIVISRSEAWVKDTALKLNILIQQMASSLQGNSNWRVRLALIEMAQAVLMECTISMHVSTSVCLETLVGLIGDDYPNVARKSREALIIFRDQHLKERAQPLIEILEENLHLLATVLPRKMRTATDEEKLCQLNLLSGYIRLLGSHINGMLRSAPHLKRLTLALVQVLEFDCSDIKIVEHQSLVTGYATGVRALNPHTGTMAVQPRKYFKHFHADEVYAELMTICHLLGFHGDLDILTDCFMDLLHETQVYRLQCTLILSEIIAGCNGPGKDMDFSDTLVEPQTAAYRLTPEHFEDLIEMLIDEYLSASLFQLPVSHLKMHSVASNTSGVSLSLVPSSSSDNRIDNINRNILQICLVLEGIAKFAQVLSIQFKPMLIKVLYPLMESLASENAFISNTAYLSLVDICDSCQYLSIDALLQGNADYLVNAITLKLRHLSQNPSAPLVLKVTLQYSSAEILPLMYPNIQEVMISLDDHYADMSVLFMSVLHELVLAVKRWFPPTQPPSKKSTIKHNDVYDIMPIKKEDECVKQKTSSEEIADYFLEYHKQKELAAGKVTDDDLADVSVDDSGVGSEEADESEEKKKDLPKHVETVKEVLTRSKHLLSSRDPRLRLLVLDTIASAAQALQDYENELLPLIHQVWSPLTQRFVDEEHLVILKAFQTLCTLSRVCGDFICARTVNDALPKISTFLQKQANVSIKTGPAYKFTVGFKLQHAMLSEIGILCASLGIGVGDVNNIVDGIARACVPYLSARQPDMLQKACIETFTHLIQLQSDALWLLLNDVSCQTMPVPPSSEFPSIQFCSSVGQRSEYADNVEKILHLL